MKEFICSKCGSTDLWTDTNGTATGLYCCNCGSWIKWLNKNEIRAFKGIKFLSDISIPTKEDKQNMLESVSKPLIEFMNKYCCPHDYVVIQQGRVELLNGEIGFPTEIPD